MLQPNALPMPRFLSKRLVLVLFLAPWVGFSSGCGSSSNALSGGLGPASGLISALGEAVPGLSQEQVIAAAGALFNLAQSNMLADQFSALTEAVPGADALIDRATDAGLPSEVSAMSGVMPFLSEQGITPDQVSQLVPALGQQVSSLASDDLASAFLSAVQ